MGRQVKVDSHVLKVLLDRVPGNDMEKIFVNWIIDGRFSDEDDCSGALRMFLHMDEKAVEFNSKYPSSKDSEIQSLLEGLRDTIFSISGDGMEYHSKNRRWIADPNTVTITVQDARAHNLRITVYGRPKEFEDIRQSLEIQEDMSGYSRFTLNNKNELPSAINVIQRSYKLKTDRRKPKKGAILRLD